MKTRIFTPRERRIIQDWLAGRDVDPRPLSVITARLRGFKELASDVELYLKASRKAKPSKAAST